MKFPRFWWNSLLSGNKSYSDSLEIFLQVNQFGTVYVDVLYRIILIYIKCKKTDLALNTINQLLTVLLPILWLKCIDWFIPHRCQDAKSLFDSNKQQSWRCQTSFLWLFGSFGCLQQEQHSFIPRAIEQHLHLPVHLRRVSEMYSILQKLHSFQQCLLQHRWVRRERLHVSSQEYHDHLQHLLRLSRFRSVR